jgi:hypothetical protein
MTDVQLKEVACCYGTRNVITVSYFGPYQEPVLSRLLNLSDKIFFDIRP